MTAQCYCGGIYRCGTCRHDVCYCNCKPAAGHVNPSPARLTAWAEKQELTR